MNIKKVDILDIPFVSTHFEQMADLLTKRIIQNEKTFIVTANPEIVMYAHEDPSYMDYVRKADYVVPDGNGILLAGKILKRPIQERIAGFDLSVELLKRGNELGWKIYLLGGKEEVNTKAVKNINRDYPNIHIAGSHNGFFDWKDTSIQKEIAHSQPDLILVALGVPRQEKWIVENIDAFTNGIFIGVGGTIDVLAGEVKRAPKIWQELKLEWFYRLIKQPSRWRRMLAIPKFVMKVVKQRFL